jgi:SAM-dependent methyltransferase
MTSHSCLVCGSGDLTQVIELGRIPVQCSSLISTREQALKAATGDIQLVLCRNCGHMFNAAFNPDLVEYDGDYENSLDCSPAFTAYLKSVATGLFRRYGLRGRSVLEIGCGQASFLKLFLRLGAKQATGFDPSYVDPAGGEPPGLTVFRKLFTEDCAEDAADLVCCRHTLEHISDPVSFLSAIRNAYGSSGTPPLYFEVPNGAAIFGQDTVWDIIYPHVSYFTAGSIAAAFRRGGISPGLIYETFGGQFLSILTGTEADSFPGETAAANIADLAAAARSFSQHYQEMVTYWTTRLAEMEACGDRTVVWGSGAKAVSFLNAIGSAGRIRCVVDINPRRQGKFIPGAGQQIVAPGFLSRHQPDAVIVMNPFYVCEVKAALAGLGLTCDILTVDLCSRAVVAA